VKFWTVEVVVLVVVVVVVAVGHMFLAHSL